MKEQSNYNQAKWHSKIKDVYSDIRQKTRILGELRQDIITWKTQRRDHTAISTILLLLLFIIIIIIIIIIIVLLLLLLLLFLSLLLLLLLLFLFILLLPPSVILFCIKTKINTRPIRFLTPLSVVWLKGRMLPRMWQRKFESDQELRWQKQWVLFPGTKSVSKSMVSKKSNLGSQTASKAKLTLPTVEYTHFNHWWAKKFFEKLIIIEQNNRKCGQKLHTLLWAVAHVTFVAKETRSLKTGRGNRSFGNIRNSVEMTTSRFGFSSTKWVDLGSETNVAGQWEREIGILDLAHGLPGQKKRTIIEIRGEKNAVPRVISCSIRRDQRRASPIRDCPRLLPCADRAWSSMISHVEQRSSRRESRWWFFFFFCPG